MITKSYESEFIKAFCKKKFALEYPEYTAYKITARFILILCRQKIDRINTLTSTANILDVSYTTSCIQIRSRHIIALLIF